jgi:hypothetical protein
MLIEMKNSGIDARGAEEVLTHTLLHGVGILSEKEEDRIRDLLDVVYGHCAEAFRVWEKDPNGNSN